MKLITLVQKIQDAGFEARLSADKHDSGYLAGEEYLCVTVYTQDTYDFPGRFVNCFNVRGGRIPYEHSASVAMTLAAWKSKHDKRIPVIAAPPAVQSDDGALTD
jgi:hypothetical protein